MNKYTFTDEHSTYTRISKQTARKLWAKGANNIALCPVKMRPGYPFAMHMTLGQSEEHKEYGFEKYVRNFEWYNANCYETGYYTAFYIVTNDSDQTDNNDSNI